MLEAGELKPQNWLIENAYKFYQQALADMGALRIEVYDNGHQFWMPAAGIPWFVAVFGRDSIIASLQAIAVDHEFARGTLLKLAQLQATELDDWHDAQPGKMLHEMRRDELTTLNLLPYHPYYGTVDTTILWIVTLAEAYNWNADVSMLDECRAPLENALSWIDKYGDFDGDGFVEYLRNWEVGSESILVGFFGKGTHVKGKKTLYIEPSTPFAQTQFLTE